MVDKPDIVKKLREEEKLGTLESSLQGSHEELEFPEELPKNTSDESTEFFKEEFGNMESNVELTQHGSSSGDLSIDERELLFQSTSDLMLYLDKHGKIAKINRAGIAYSDFSEDEIIGQFFWKLPGVLSKHNIPKYLKVFKNVLKGKPTKNFLNELHEKSGKKHIMNFSTYPIKENEKITSILVVAKDLTEQKEAEDKYRLITEKTSDLITTATFTLNPIFTYISPSHKKTIGYEPSDLIGKPFFDFVHPDDKKKLHFLLKKYLSVKVKKLLTGKDSDVSEKVEIRFRDKSGNWRYMETTANLMGNEIVSVSKDVTDRRKAEEELKEVSSHFQTLFNSMVDPVVILNPKGKFLEVTDRVKEITGFEKDDLIGKNSFKTKLLTRKSKAICIKNLLKRMSGMKVAPYEVEVLTKDGRKLPFELNAERISYKGKPADMVAFRDISDRKQAEEKLKEASERLELAMDAGEHGFWDWNLDTDDVYFSPRYYTMLGYEPGELPMRLETWANLMHPEDRKDIVPRVQKYVENAEPYEVEFRLKCKDGSWKWISGRGKMFDKDEKGVPHRAVGVHVDIAERKAAEEKLKEAHELLKTLNENLERTVEERTAKIEKLLKQKDEFVNQLGHDLKNPLGPLINLIPVLKKDETDSERKEIFEVLNRNVSHMKNLVTKTIQLARLNAPSTEFNLEDTDLFSETDATIKMNKSLFEENNMEIDNRISDKIIIKADKLRLTELFDNLFNNAIKYTKDSGTITIDAKQDKDFVTVSIKDTGVGMTEEQLSHIFDEFYKVDWSRHDFNSSGLGLPICKRIVEKHGGKIWAESKGKGKGTTMYFTFPMSSEKQQDKEQQ